MKNKKYDMDALLKEALSVNETPCNELLQKAGLRGAIPQNDAQEDAEHNPAESEHESDEGFTNRFF